jgi:hypothetical protein
MSKPGDKGVALVTGASSGIGAIYAERLARRGYGLLLVARNRQRLESLAQNLSKQYQVHSEVLSADLTDIVDLQKVQQRLRDDAAITLLVNNAGMAMEGPLTQADLNQVTRMINLNVLAFTHLATAAAANFSARGSGAIINIGSVVALIPEMFNAVYSASKAYVLSLSQTMQHELDEKGVQVQAVLPGVTRTEIWERSGMNVEEIPAEMVMEVDELVDAALAGFDRGEKVTLPSLPDPGDWEAMLSARAKLQPNLSLRHAAARYKTAK